MARIRLNQEYRTKISNRMRAPRTTNRGKNDKSRKISLCF